MRINEVYEHEPLIPYQGADPHPPATGCDKTARQCVEVSLPLKVTPNASTGTITTTCEGNPVVTCTAAADGRSLTVTVTQRVCLSIPVRFGADAEPEPEKATIACGGTDTDTDMDDDCDCLL